MNKLISWFKAKSEERQLKRNIKSHGDVTHFNWSGEGWYCKKCGIDWEDRHKHSCNVYRHINIKS